MLYYFHSETFKARRAGNAFGPIHDGTNGVIRNLDGGAKQLLVVCVLTPRRFATQALSLPRAYVI